MTATSAIITAEMNYEKYIKVNSNYGDSEAAYLDSPLWNLKVKSYFHALDVDNDGFLTMKDYSMVGDRMLNLQRGNTINKEDILSTFRKLFEALVKPGVDIDTVQITLDDFLKSFAAFVVCREKAVKTFTTYGNWFFDLIDTCLLYTSPSPRDQRGSRMPSSA